MKELILIMLLVTTVAHADTYKWIDGEGAVHFSETVGEIPTKYRESAKSLGMDTLRNSKDAAGTGKESKQNAGGEAAGTPPAGDLKTRMMNDEEIMELILSLQNDPDMQAILSDPSVMQAVQAGDTGALMKNPVFLKLINNPRVREIVKKMKASGAGAR
ncbi:MAG TPA: DUF4124 domain-containing protein [Geobacteraceae bacterium]|nr:DUF4124 domain-containing protein [Geobacteraceae bacterium]